MGALYDIPFYPGYKLRDDGEIIGKRGYPLAKHGDSHKMVNVYCHGKAGTLYVHRAVALVHVDGYFEGAWVDHIDDNPSNNDPSNLRWVCPRENNYRNKHHLRTSIEKCKTQIKKLQKRLEYLNSMVQ